MLCLTGGAMAMSILNSIGEVTPRVMLDIKIKTLESGELNNGMSQSTVIIIITTVKLMMEAEIVSYP